VPASQTRRKLPSILLIDDDAISREVMQLTLEMQGMVVETAEDGAIALSWLGSGVAHPDAILMDTQMPGLSGVELIAALRKATAARIIAISGSEVSEAIRNATDGFLLKPVETDQLMALLESKPAEKVDIQAAAGRSTSPGGMSKPLTGRARRAASAAASAGPGGLIDPVVLGKLKAMMPAAAVLEIYTAVAADLEKRLPSLAEAIAAGNAKEASGIAHAIKGSCSMVGLSGAAAAASRIETGNLAESRTKELLQLNAALSTLQGILCDGLP
jgi:CheY-like chemotaxis protein